MPSRRLSRPPFRIPHLVNEPENAPQRQCEASQKVQILLDFDTI